MHITYRYERNLTYVQLDDPDSVRTPQSIITLIDKRISDLRDEEAAIRQICVKLSLFLKANSITPFNDDMLEYFNHFIKEEKQKRMEGKDNADIIRGLEEMIRDYTQEVNLFTRNISPATDTMDNSVQIDEIFTLVQQLYDLPINGKLIAEQINRMKEGRVQAATSAEQYVDLPTGSNSPQILKNLKDSINRQKR
jgi:hypothetical protein